ncbi:MAG: GerAB/ArcD/ProY family transporter [Eubacteriales bacterium]|nr:GerAB/ArcD/ProY family transporter [Eubacteriales bacterium]
MSTEGVRIIQKTDRISRRQLHNMAFVALLSPVIRQIPRTITLTTGRTAWLAGILSFLPCLLVAYFLKAFLRSKAPDEGLGEVFLHALGPVFGRLAILLYTLWMLFYAGFVLRTGADRFISTVYPNSRPWIFVSAMLILALLAGLGRLKVLARTAELVRPLLIAVFVVVFSFALPDVRKENLLPVSILDTVPLLISVLPVVNTLSLVLYTAFLDNRTEPGRIIADAMENLILLLLVVTFLCMTTIGIFGAELTVRMNHPFFVMIRNIEIFNLFERVEAVVIALWVVTDYVLVSLLLQICSGNLCLIVKGPGAERTKLSVWICAAAALIVSIFIAPTSFRLEQMTRAFIPISSSILLFVGLPVIFLIGRLRKKI